MCLSIIKQNWKLYFHYLSIKLVVVRFYVLWISSNSSTWLFYHPSFFYFVEVVRRHEELLCAYRDLRAQVELLGRDDLDLGPDEHEMMITDAELQSAQQKEIVRLQSEIHNLRINNKRVGAA